MIDDADVSVSAPADVAEDGDTLPSTVDKQPNVVIDLCGDGDANAGAENSNAAAPPLPPPVPASYDDLIMPFSVPEFEYQTRFPALSADIEKYNAKKKKQDEAELKKSERALIQRAKNAKKEEQEAEKKMKKAQRESRKRRKPAAQTRSRRKAEPSSDWYDYIGRVGSMMEDFGDEEELTTSIETCLCFDCVNSLLFLLYSECVMTLTLCLSCSCPLSSRFDAGIHGLAEGKTEIQTGRRIDCESNRRDYVPRERRAFIRCGF